MADAYRGEGCNEYHVMSVTFRQDGWHVHDDTDGPVHVWPRGDNVSHDIDGLHCICGPDVEWRDPATGDGYEVPLVLHHSLDGREQQERRQ